MHAKKDAIKTVSRRIPVNLLYFLMDCHERELMNFPPVEATHRSAKGLMIRGFLKTCQYVDGKAKVYTCACVTKEGKAYLQQVSNE